MTWPALLEAAEAVRADAGGRDSSVAGLTLAGIGWATVEHQRAVRELDALLAADGGPGAADGAWVPIGRDPALGARSWLRQVGGSAGGPELVVLEPDTEGRLAASLARFGEGVAVVYLGDGRPGPGTLVRGGPPWGPYAILVEPLGSGER